MKNGIKVPALGESVVEARIAQWLKNEGDPVAVGDVLVELETEKVNVDVTAEASGILSRIIVKKDETVHIGDNIGEIETEVNVQRNTEQRSTDGEAKEEVRSKTAAISDLERVTPVAKRVAEKTGLNLSEVSGSGTGGRVTKHDVESFLQTHEQAAKPQNGDRAPGTSVEHQGSSTEISTPGARATERVRMSLRRKTIARRMVEAQQTAAMLTTFNEIDMSRVMELRKNYKENFKKKYGANLGIVSFFVKAVIAALKDFPRLNAEIDGDEIVYKYYYDIGVAIGAEEGLVVPVLRNAEKMSFGEIESTIKNFAEKSSNGTLTLEDLRGGTFTITNGGVFGSLMSTPILNPPQVGILGLHKISERPVVADGQVIVKPMMYVALTYDHRIVDGRESVQFLVKVKEYIEDPASMLLE